MQARGAGARAERAEHAQPKPQHGPAIALSAVASGVDGPAGKSGDGPSRPTSTTAERATPDAKCTKKTCQRRPATFSSDAHEPHRKSAVNAKASDASSELG